MLKNTLTIHFTVLGTSARAVYVRPHWRTLRDGKKVFVTVIHHRFVINGQQLFADVLRNRVETCAATARQYYSFHIILFIYNHETFHTRPTPASHGHPDVQC